MIQTETLTAYRVPDRFTEPSERMIDWLATCPHEWDGDEEGISIHLDEDADPVLATPGDWVCCAQGVWFVLSANDMTAIVLYRTYGGL